MAPEFVITVGGTIVTALVGAITYLYRKLENDTKATKTELNEKLDKCEERHVAKDQSVQALAIRVAKMEERTDIATAMKEMHTDIIEAIKEQNTDDTRMANAPQPPAIHVHPVQPNPNVGPNTGNGGTS